MSDQYGPEDSATLFIPPELYERMLVTKPRAAAEAEEPVAGRSGRIARTGSGLHPVPESVTAADRPDSATLFYRGHEGRNDESTLASARDMPSGPASRDAHVQIAEPPTEDVDASALEGPADPAMAMPAVAAVAADPQFTPNGTILMQAFPYVVGQPAPEAPAPPPPPPHEVAGADSARVRRALDEMSMLIDVNAMPRRLASASDDELERYVDALRRSEGLPDAATAPRTPVPPAYGNPVAVIPLPHEIAAWQASNQAYVQGGHPQPFAAPQAQGHAPPPMAPHGEFALPTGFVRHDIVPVAAPIAPQRQARNTLVSPVADPKKPAKRGSAAATAMFAVMFLVTLVGVGAVTYVALRSGDAAAAVTTVRH